MAALKLHCFGTAWLLGWMVPVHLLQVSRAVGGQLPQHNNTVANFLLFVASRPSLILGSFIFANYRPRLG